MFKMNKIKHKKGNVCKIINLKNTKIKFKGKKNKVFCENIKSSNIKITGLFNDVTLFGLNSCTIEVHGSNNIIVACGNITESKIIIIGNNNKINLNNVVVEKSGIEIHSTKSCIFIDKQTGDKSKIFKSKISIFESGDIRIGKESILNEVLIWNATQVNKEPVNVIIGNHCMLGDSSIVETTDHHPITYEDGTKNDEKDIALKDKVWLGRGAEIRKGVIINENIIVATRSVVTKDLTESNRIYAGIPAKVVGKKFKEWMV